MLGLRGFVPTAQIWKSGHGAPGLEINEFIRRSSKEMIGFREVA